MAEKNDIGSIVNNSPEQLAREMGHRSARSGVRVSKVIQNQLKKNPAQMEEFLKGAQSGQREKQESERKKR